MKKLESNTLSVGELFSSEYFFTVPNYQRPFSWDRDQLSDLVDDLTSANRESDYFLGTLVLHEREGRLFDIVDGQQRITALSLLLATMRDLLDQDENEVQEMLVQPGKKFKQIPARVRLSVRDAAPFENIVAAEGGTTVQSDPNGLETTTTQRYRIAVDTFRQALANLKQVELQSLVTFVVQRVIVIVLSAKTFDDAFRLFTVVNDRGKQLRRIDILKASNLSPEVIADEVKRDQYARKWEDYEETLGESDFEGLFHALRLLYVQEKPEGDLLHEFETRVFGKPQRPKQGEDFVKKLGEYVELYESIFLTRDYLASSPDHARFKTLMYSMDREFRASEWRACVLYFAHRFKRNGMMKFLCRIEAMYTSQWASGIRKDERYSAYTTILKAIETSKTGDTVIDLITRDDEAIARVCSSKNFYGAGAAKYLLIRAEIASSEIDTPREFSARSIEHILPQNPKEDSGWRESFTDEQHEALVHSAGNLVLLSKAKNSSAQNKDFAQKKLTYLKPRISDYPRSLAAIAEASWTPSGIEERTAAFVNLMTAELFADPVKRRKRVKHQAGR